jgi:raffinose/stachyose/melibiose transport system substrate-binding protein
MPIRRRDGTVAPGEAGPDGHVFVSYQHGTDGGYVDRLAAYLTGNGIPVWFDREIVTGDRWLEVIRRQIDTCSAMVVVMTPQAEASRWVERELARAEEMHRPIVPLLRRGHRFFQLADIQYEDVSDGQLPGEKFVQRLRMFLPNREVELASQMPLQASEGFANTPAGVAKTQVVPPASPPLTAETPVPSSGTRARSRRRRLAATVAAILLVAAFIWLPDDRGGGDGAAPSKTRHGPSGDVGPHSLSLLTPAEDATIRTALSSLAEKQCATADKALPFKSDTIARADMVQKITLLASQDSLPVMFAAGTAQVRPTGNLGKGERTLDYEQTLKDLGAWDNILPAAASTVKAMYGSMASLPFQYNIEGVFYNKKLFAEYGVNPPATWTDLVGAAKYFKAEGAIPITEAGSEGWPVTRMIGNHIFRNLGPDAMAAVRDGKAKLTDSQYVAAAQAIAQLGTEGLFGPSVTSRTTDAANAQFLNGQAAMMYNGSWFLADLNDPKQNKIGAENVGFVPFPTVAGGKGNVSQWPANTGDAIAMSKKAYGPKVGEWLGCIAQNYGSSIMQNQGVISGFRLNQPVSNIPPLTDQLQKMASESSQSVLWFEALFDAKTTKDAQTNVVLLLTGELTPEKYMAILQADLDQAH